MTRVVAYVDGFNLYFGLKNGYGRRYHWLDLQALATSLLQPGQELREVQYFTAGVKNDPEGARRQSTYSAGLPRRGPISGEAARVQELRRSVDRLRRKGNRR